MAHDLTHFGPDGAARMVSLDEKAESSRMAVAIARVTMAPTTLTRIADGTMGKGDVLQVARIAAISGCKTTAGAIPLCHPVRLTAITVNFELRRDDAAVDIRVEVRAVDRTGPEMEAMHGASIAALTIYDMCKAIDRGMLIERVALAEKSGGKSGHWIRPSNVPNAVATRL